MVRVENGVVLYTPYGEEEREIGNLADAEVFEGYLSLGGHGFPLERFTELQTAWDELYPNGKPVEVIETKRVVTEEEKALDLVKQLMKNDDFLKSVGIEPRKIT